jgi:hypothetical protein
MLPAPSRPFFLGGSHRTVAAPTLAPEEATGRHFPDGCFVPLPRASQESGNEGLLMNSTAPATNRANELDRLIADGLCRMIDCLEFKTNLFSEVGVEEVKHWIKLRAAFYIAARDTGLVELVESESLFLNMLPQSYPNYKTVHRRFQTWCRDKVLRSVLTDIANEFRAPDLA